MSIGTLLEFGAASSALRISKAWFEAAIPLGFAMMIVRLVQALIRDVARPARGPRGLSRRLAVRLTARGVAG